MERILYSVNGIYSIENEIKSLYYNIKKTSDINEAAIFFQKLEDIQFVLAKAIFKNGLNTTSFLNKFVSDFDRIDDDDVKQCQYQRIKNSIIWVMCCFCGVNMDIEEAMSLVVYLNINSKEDQQLFCHKEHFIEKLDNSMIFDIDDL